MKLTIEQLKNYLGTGLKCQSSNDAEYRRNKDIPVEFEMYGLTDGYAMIDCSVLQTDCEYEDLFPLCYRLSDLDKFIPELGFVPIDDFFIRYGGGVSESGKEIWKKDFMDNILYSPIGVIHFDIVQKIFQWHFWPFGDEYFEAGLVIDKLLYNFPTH